MEHLLPALANLSLSGCRGLGQLLLEELLSCWTECAPGQLEMGPELTAVQCMEAILQCLASLLDSQQPIFPTGALSPLAVLEFCDVVWPAAEGHKIGAVQG